MRRTFRNASQTMGLALSALSVMITWSAIHEPVPIVSYVRWTWPAELRADEDLHIKAVAWRSKSGCSSRVERTWWQDGVEVPESRSTFMVDTPPENPERYQRLVTVPSNVRPGRVLMHTESRFFCNPVQKITGGALYVLPDVELWIKP